MATDVLNLFALVVDEKDPIRRIPLSGSLQSEVTDFLSDQIKSFVLDREKVAFSGRYNASEGEVFRIPNYPLDTKIIDAIMNPLRLKVLDLRNDTPRIVALLTGKWSGGSRIVGFQGFDSRKILSKSFTILNSGETYTRLEDPGLTLQDRLTALFQKSEMLFYSYHNARHFLDLSAYYREATDTDLKDFASHKSLYVDNRQNFIENADSMIRKKIALLQKNNVMQTVSVKDIKSAAQKYDVKVQIRGRNQLVIPTDKAELKNLLRFLDEDYFTTVLTQRKCLTNSKEYL